MTVHGWRLHKHDRTPTEVIQQETERTENRMQSRDGAHTGVRGPTG